VWVLNIYIAESEDWVEEPEEYDTKGEAEEAAEDLRLAYMPPDIVKVRRIEHD
jgi:hypothetical protein